MYYRHAPRTCENFIKLARQVYYNNVKFQESFKDLIVKGGDPTGTGTGDESSYIKHFDDEIRRELKHTGAVIISMANAGPNTNGSQFFYNFGTCIFSGWKHTVFGRCRGMEIVKSPGSDQTDNADRPIHDVKIH